MIEDNQQWKPLTEEEKKKLADELFAGELRDLAHLRGVKAAWDGEPIPYEGDVSF